MSREVATDIFKKRFGRVLGHDAPDNSDTSPSNSLNAGGGYSVGLDIGELDLRNDLLFYVLLAPSLVLQTERQLAHELTASLFVATSSVRTLRTSTRSSHDFWICSSNPVVSCRLRSRYLSGSGSAFRPENDVKTDEISPPFLFFRVGGTASVAIRRLLGMVPAHLPA